MSKFGKTGRSKFSASIQNLNVEKQQTSMGHLSQISPWVSPGRICETNSPSPFRITEQGENKDSSAANAFCSTVIDDIKNARKTDMRKLVEDRVTDNEVKFLCGDKPIQF